MSDYAYGRLYCWGNDAQGQAGRGKSGPPVELTDSVELKFTPNTVVCGWDHTVALDQEGAIWAWGSNEFGQLGDGSETDRWKPRRVHKLKHETSVQIACGAHNTAALLEGGRVFQWGRFTLSNSPHEVRLPFPVRMVACGFAHMAAVSRDGRVFTWGYNERGELGHGDTFEGLRKPRELTHFNRTGVPGLEEEDDVDDDIPLEAEKPPRVVSIACGAHHTACITDDAQVYTWGDGSGGQLGHLTGHLVLYPKHVAALEHAGVTQVSCGAKHTAFVTKEGALMVCGHHGYGVLGLGKPAPSLAGILSRSERQLYTGTGRSNGDPVQRVPTIVVPSGVQQVSCGAGHTIICTTSGQVWACGYNCYGQCSGSLGGLDEIWYPRLLQPLRAGDVMSVAAGAGHTAVLSQPQTLKQRAIKQAINSPQQQADGLEAKVNAFMKQHTEDVALSEAFSQLPAPQKEELEALLHFSGTAGAKHT